MLLLNGYLGGSSEDKHTRLYFDAQLSSYVEIPDDSILHTQDYPAESSPLGGSYVWIKKDAVLTHGKAGTERAKGKFLEGPIVNDYMKAAAWPQEGGIDNTVAFCPITFADLPCGFTTIPIACTIVQIPTQEAHCPTNWHCPPPPTPNCPTHRSPFICHTKICEFQYKNPVGQAQAQPWPTLPQICTSPLTVNSPVCPTRLLICNYTVSGAICPTHTPACFPTTNGTVCATHTPGCITHAAYCPTQIIQHCQPTLAGCPVQSVVCPTFGACPSIACGFGGAGNPGY